MRSRPPALSTPRLKLRAHRLEDLPACAKMWADPKVVRFIGGQPFNVQQSWSKILAYAGMWVMKGYGFWAVEEKASGKFVGELGFADFQRDIKPSFKGAPELGWAFASEAHGKGYATEALRAILKWGDKRLDAERVVCIIDPAHAASVRVAEKCGFKKARPAVYRGAPTVIYERRRA